MFIFVVNAEKTEEKDIKEGEKMSKELKIEDIKQGNILKTNVPLQGRDAYTIPKGTEVKVTKIGKGNRVFWITLDQKSFGSADIKCFEK